jgi:hypothetical protein
MDPVCTGQAYVLNEKLIAFNVPNSYHLGEFNDYIEQPHAYIQALTPEGVKSGGAWARSNGATIEPTNNVHITDGMFGILVGREYNDPLRQKLRVKTQYASTLEEKERDGVIRDILQENPEFAPAHILKIGEKPPNDVMLENWLDIALFHQALVWHYADIGETGKMVESFHKMVEFETDPIRKTGWTLQTWANVEDIEMQIALVPEFGKTSPDYPGTIGSLVMFPLSQSEHIDKDAFQKAEKELIQNAREKNPDFKEVMETFF